MSLGDDCIVEAGLYLTAGTIVTLPGGRQAKARELSGSSGLVFRRNSVTGAVEACHGLPVEYEIDKTHGIKCREDVMKMGIAQYNAHCRSIVMRYGKEWQVTVRRGWLD